MGALVYEKEKVEQYWLAVKDWNDCDNSKRHKISERIYQVAVSTGPGETSTDDGTQTSTEGTQSSIETDDGTQPSTENDDFAA
jgi:hypothetical protein